MYVKGKKRYPEEKKLENTTIFSSPIFPKNVGKVHYQEFNFLSINFFISKINILESFSTFSLSFVLFKSFQELNIALDDDLLLENYEGTYEIPNTSQAA